MNGHSAIIETWMRHALALAPRGRGFVEPNPMVGAVVLDANGHLVGEGWHQKFGEAHAEIHALTQAGERARGGTLIVTLEPCCHHGKTPPCTDAVLRSGVKHVFVAMADPFPKVAGGGIAVLREAGLTVEVGVCEADARKLNAPYLKLLQTGRPWVHLKWAMSLDGKIATRTGDSKWISGEESRQRVHELRGRVDAILVGRGTVDADDPLLTARPPGARVATRIVLSASGDLPERCQLRATAREIPVLVFTRVESLSNLSGWAADGCEVIPLPGSDNGLSLDAVLAELGRRRMTNVLVEGGAGILGAFIDAGAADELHVFIAPKIIGGDSALSPVGGMGIDFVANALSLSEVTTTQSGEDVYIHGMAARTHPELPMSSRRLFLLATPLFLLPLLAPARQDADKFAAIKPAMQKFVDSGELAGAVTLVGNKKGILHHEAVGQRDIVEDVPMRKNTLFRIASMTKPITAIGIMILVDEGKLSPDDDVAKHLPEFADQKLADGKKPARPIKIRDLLTHTAGLPNYPKEFAEIYSKRDRTIAETTKAVAGLPLQFEPGSKWAYCNPGIDTLGRIIEVASGESYEAFLKKRVFDPLGINDTVFYPNADQMKRLAITYKKAGGKLVPDMSLIGLPEKPKHPIPAGGLVSSGGDLAKLYRMMLNNGELGGKRILSEKAVAEMTKTQTGDIVTGFVPGMSFGYGWAVVKEPKGVTAMLSPGTFGHGGAFGTQGWIDPKQDLFVILLIQRADLGNGDASPMRQTLQELAFKTK